MDYPLRNHPYAFKAAEAAECAGEHGKYWEMHDVLFENSRALGAERLPDYAAQIGLDRASFEECLASGRHAEEINGDLAEANRAGIRATPSFLFGRAQPGGAEVEFERQLRGAQPLDQFVAVIDSLLREGEPSDDEL